MSNRANVINLTSIFIIYCIPCWSYNGISNFLYSWFLSSFILPSSNFESYQSFNFSYFIFINCSDSISANRLHFILLCIHLAEHTLMSHSTVIQKKKDWLFHKMLKVSYVSNLFFFIIDDSDIWNYKFIGELSIYCISRMNELCTNYMRTWALTEWKFILVLRWID